MKRRIRLNPHVEAHGHHALEWSFHFPLQAGDVIEAELALAFPGEKVPGPARDALAAANLTSTRLSLADAASDVRRLSLLCLTDSLWACERVGVGKDDGRDVAERASSAPKFFIHRAKEYWSVGFFSRLGLMLQSDLKSGFKAVCDALSESEGGGVDWTAYARAKRHIMSSFRAGARIVALRFEWERLTCAGTSAHNLPVVMPPQSLILALPEGALTLDALLAQLRSVSELALVLMCKALAELQELLEGFRRRCDEALLLVVEERGEGENSQERERVLNTLARLKFEAGWTASWARWLVAQREGCGLVSLAEVAMNAQSATAYFERVLELKRQHYQVFDLHESMRPNDNRVDFWIGGIAAGVAALFAAVATVIVTFWLQGRVNFDFSTTSIIALSVFTFVNVVIYILKDRMKEWLKTNARRYLRVSSGRWDGICTFCVPGPIPGTLVDRKVAEVRRRSWWSRSRDKWHFHVWERYEIQPEAVSLGASIAKQIWRLPLDEILDKLDDSRHVIKVPTTEGIPQEIPVLKRVVFPFRTSISVLSKVRRRLVLGDQAKLAGVVVASGGRLLGVE